MVYVHGMLLLAKGKFSDGDGFNWHCHNQDTGDIPSVHCQLQYVKLPTYGVEGISFGIMYHSGDVR